MKLPNLLVIGARKCGTSSMYHYLGRHPEISMSRLKEPNFFLADGSWGRGRDWYESLFAHGGSVRARGEASTAYTSYPEHRGVPERIHSVVPDVKLIYLVRDPIERIVSDYVDAVARGWEDRPLNEAVIPSLDCPYVARSSYSMQLDQYLAHFPAERMLVLTREELLSERRAALRRAFGFLGVDDSFDSPMFDEIRNQSSQLRRMQGWRWLPRSIEPAPDGRFSWAVRKRAKRTLLWPVSRKIERPTIGGELRGALVLLLKPDADRLRSFTGRALEGWAV